jgi:quercetin dioxygenase-like cupin family protein
MRVIDLRSQTVARIEAFGSFGASSTELASGGGPSHVHAVRIEAGGMIGPHVAGFCQLFLVISGVGWVAGEDAARCPLEAGQAAFIALGEMHSKGAESSLLALIVQVEQLTVPGAG